MLKDAPKGLCVVACSYTQQEQESIECLDTYCLGPDHFDLYQASQGYQPFFK